MLLLDNWDSSSGLVECNINDGRWHHYCIAWDGTKGNGTLYEDGQDIFSATRSQWKGQLDGVQSIVLGQEQDSFGGNFDKSQNHGGGKQSQVNMWGVTLNADEVSRLYMARGVQKIAKQDMLLVLPKPLVAWSDLAKPRHRFGNTLLTSPSEFHDELSKDDVCISGEQTNKQGEFGEAVLDTEPQPDTLSTFRPAVDGAVEPHSCGTRSESTIAHVMDK